jgi:hypothetical protein
VASDIEAAQNALREVRTELAEIWNDLQRGRDSATINERLRRWKDRSVEAIRTHVSAAEASQFALVDVAPNWIVGEGVHAPIRKNAAFLAALEQELEHRPGSVIALAPAPAPRLMGGKPFTFLSHASVDAPLAAHLETALRASTPSLEVFRTTRVDQIPSGRAWFEHITAHLRAATQYVVLLTPNSQSRPWVCFEAGGAWATDRTRVLALGGGLQAGDTIEPLRQLQLLSLEEHEQAAQVFRALGTTLADPKAFAETARRIGRDTPAATTGKARVEGRLLDLPDSVVLRLENTGTAAAHQIQASVDGEPVQSNPYFARPGVGPVRLLAPGAHVDFPMLVFDGMPRAFRVRIEWIGEGGQPDRWESDLTRP